jgi:DMSO reductase anchor subunit
MDGSMPACSTACPTGALGYGKLADQAASEKFSWFPEKNLKPSIELTGSNNTPLRVIPEIVFDDESELTGENEPVITEEWSLVAFSFLTTLSVAEFISALVKGIFPQKLYLIFIIVLAALLSLLHLGRKLRAWMAVFSLRNSPLSREIGLFIIYALFSGVTLFSQLPVLLIATSASGLLLLISIDAVYLFADRRKSVLLHSGQTFITVLLMVSFLTGKILPFIFIAAIKLGITLWNLILKKERNLKFVMRFVRSAILILAGISMITRISYPEPAVISLFLAGELLDRILFYIDFKPLNISRLINSHITDPEK